MRLASIYELKQELRAESFVTRALGPPLGVGPPRPRHGRAIGRSASARAGLPVAREPLEVAFSLGVARGVGRGDYRLGVRVLARGGQAEELAGLIRKEAKNEVDLRFVPEVRARAAARAAWFRRRQRPLEPGLSVGPVIDELLCAGTLGAFVQDDDGVYILSNNHVLANVNDVERGEAIVQPGTLDRVASGRALVATLDRYIPLSFGRKAPNLVDCALAKLDEGMRYIPRYTSALPGRIRPPRPLGEDDLGRPVAKAGRTTGCRRGVVNQVAIDGLDVNMGGGPGARVAWFDGQIEIVGDDGRPFSEAGDSGSLIVDDAGYARALLFAGGVGDGEVDLTFANPIERVLGSLGVRLA